MDDLTRLRDEIAIKMLETLVSEGRDGRERNHETGDIEPYQAWAARAAYAYADAMLAERAKTERKDGPYR